MKKFACSFALLLWLCVEQGSALAETNLDPVITSLLGKVTIGPKVGSSFQATDHQAVPVGSQVTTVGSSAALLSLVPGVKTRLKGQTAIRLKNAQVSSSSRNAEMELVKGTVLCHVKKQGSPKQKYRVDMGPQEWMEAVAAMWQASTYENRHSLAVLSGTVLWTCLPDPGEISVSAGSVLISQYETRQEESVLTSVSLVNLATGTYTYYGLNGTEPVTSKATVEELNVARSVFSEALGDQFANLGSTERTAFVSLLYDTNHTLALAGLPAVTAPAPAPAVVANTVTSTNPEEATSPITP